MTKRLAMKFGVLGLAAALWLAAPAPADACCWGLGCCRSVCGWRASCGWGWGGCGWGCARPVCGWGCGPAWGGSVWGAGPVWGSSSVVVVNSPMIAPIYPYADLVMGGVLADPPILVSPRRVVYTSPSNVIAPRQRVNPSAPPTPEPPAEALPAPTEAVSSRIEVRVPTADAQVWFSGHKTQKTGLARTFETPALEPGRTYTYDVKVAWTDEKGLPQEDSYRLEVSSGKQAVVAFGAKPGDTSSWVASRR